MLLQADLRPACANGGLRASILYREWVGAHGEQVGPGRVEEGWERGFEFGGPGHRKA